MQIHLAHGWIYFCVAFGIMLITTFIMGRLSRHFFTQDVVLRRFSIMDLEWPASPRELVNLLKGMYELPGKKQQKAISSLRKHLYTDFIFMPAAYGSIFLLCMHISWKMTFIGPYIFAALAWLQVVALLLDIIENIYLLKRIRPDITESTITTHKNFEKLEYFKWGIALISTICALSAVLYFWLVGRYAAGSLKYVGMVVAEIILFLIAGKIAAKFIRSVNDDTAN